jgi:two-component system, NtrC family, response regulator AtoC
MKPAILLVDKEIFVLTALDRILAEIAPDYEILTVVRGAGALTLIAQRPVALVITDQAMPSMDGLTLTAAIKAAAPQCPVILMTGSDALEIEQRAAAAGADYFLPKPFQLEAFVSTVRAALTQCAHADAPPSSSGPAAPIARCLSP